MIMMLVILFLCVIAIFYVVCKVFRTEQVIYDFSERVSLFTLLFRGLLYSIVRKQGCLISENATQGRQPENNTKLYTRTFEMKHNRIAQDNLRQYHVLLGCDEVTSIPICYPELLFQHLLLNIATSSQFRLSPLGLIHLRQTVKQHAMLDEMVDKQLDLHASIGQYRDVARGVEVDIGLKMVNDAGLCLWEGVVTLLSRNTSTQRSGSHQASNKKEKSLSNVLSEIDMYVPKWTGMRYAKVSGDWNPHHLYPWSARLLGYKMPIAHGMWTLGKIVAEMKSSYPDMFSKYPVCIEAAFKRPLFMPGTVTIKYGKQQDSSKYWFSMVDKESGVPHVIGSLQNSSTS